MRTANSFANKARLSTMPHFARATRIEIICAYLRRLDAATRSERARARDARGVDAAAAATGERRHQSGLLYVRDQSNRLDYTSLLSKSHARRHRQVESFLLDWKEDLIYDT